ncbi:hypothetical protein PJL18_04076 [Paenarthrobacter nicotinovorans]|nr:hypothetical protein [Paenarthrobacter nicotinovorans]
MRPSPDRHGFPGHHFHWPSPSAGTGHGSVERGHGKLPGRGGQPGHCGSAARVADQPCSDLRRRRLRRLQLADPGEAGARGPVVVAAGSRVALTSDCFHVREPGPLHGHPRPSRPDLCFPADWPASAGARSRCGPGGGDGAVDAGRNEIRYQAFWGGGVGPYREMVGAPAGPAGELLCFPAQRSRGHGVHRQIRPLGGAVLAG